LIGLIEFVEQPHVVLTQDAVRLLLVCDLFQQSCPVRDLVVHACLSLLY